MQVDLVGPAPPFCVSAAVFQRDCQKSSKVALSHTSVSEESGTPGTFAGGFDGDACVPDVLQLGVLGADLDEFEVVLAEGELGVVGVFLGG